MISSKFYFLWFFAISALTLISANNNKKLRIDVHYESLCPDSRNFMQNQLKPTYSKIKDKIDIKYWAFGKSYSYVRDGKTLFSCQHGSRECEGNRYQSCALDVIGPNDQDKQTAFVICAMDFLKIASNCAYDLGVDLELIDECVNGTRGTELQLEAEKYSKDVIDNSGFVPTMTYGQQFNARSQQSSLNRFHEVVKQQIEALS